MVQPAAQRFSARWNAGLGLGWIGAAALFLALSWSVLLAGHPAHLVALGGTALVGVLLLARALQLRRRPGPIRARRSLRVTGRVCAALVTLVMLATFAYLKPFGASPAAVAGMAGGSGARVIDSATGILIEPENGRAARGLVFQPGARVDPRAYVPLLTQVARSGVVVVVVKQPFAIGFLAMGAPQAVIADHPEITTWAVAGHSLGGVAASSYADAHPEQVSGLVLWAAYPLDSLADSSLAVALVSGTEDGLATPADIEASRTLLPRETAYTAVPGGVHAFFGDYGEQPGDGTPRIDRTQAQRQIVAATVKLMVSLPSN